MKFNPHFIFAYLLSLLFASSAFAFHSYEDHLAGLEVTAVCVSENTIESNSNIPVCSELVPVILNKGTENEYTNWECRAYTSQKIVLPRTIQKHTCVRFKSIGAQEDDPYQVTCTRYKVENIKLPKTIKIRQDVSKGEVSQVVWTEHTFPDCR